MSNFEWALIGAFVFALVTATMAIGVSHWHEHRRRTRGAAHPTR